MTCWQSERFAAGASRAGARRARIVVVLAALGTCGGGSPGRAAEEPPLAARVDRAVARGREALAADLARSLPRPGNYPMGRIALPLAAILKAGLPSNDPLVAECFARLESLPLEKTYSVSCYLFALDAFWQQRVRESARGDTPTLVVLRRQAQGRVRERMEELIAWLLAAELRGANRGTWHYEKNAHGFDHSNTQFAVLGLEIGIENGITIPADTLENIAEHFLRTMQPDGEPQRLSLTHALDPEEALLGTSDRTVAQRRRSPGTVAYPRVHPTGWPYLGTGAVTESMTAAGASSLMVARLGLKASNALARDLDRRIEHAIVTSSAWIAANMEKYIGNGATPYYYTIYSLEKVGDLGSIVRFGEHDWYQEGAEALLRLQKRDGGWGPSEDTSFALLFLTRATRPSLQALPPPTILTATADGRPQSEKGDLVYLDSIDGFVSAREFFAFLTQSKSARLVPVAEQVIKNYPLHRVEELMPYLLAIWEHGRDSFASFARDSLQSITGIRSSDPQVYQTFYKHHLQVAALVAAGTRDEAALSAAFVASPSTRLKTRLLHYALRETICEAVPALVRELSSGEEEYRAEVHAGLIQLAGRTPPAELGRQISKGSRRGWRELTAWWEEWWKAEGDGFRAACRVRGLVTRLAATDDAAQRGELRAALVATGNAAVPAILDGMRKDPFPVELVLALSEISGAFHGFRREEWETWWRGAGGVR